jgi:tRNA(fMet)-specific endonuclease VapC
MKYILDTDIISYFIRDNRSVIYNISKYSDEELYTTRINYIEILFGIYASDAKVSKVASGMQDFLKDINILELDEKSASIFAQTKADLKKRGEILLDMDLMIASIALSHGYTLVTNNTSHFHRIKKLKIENWS